VITVLPPVGPPPMVLRRADPSCVTGPLVSVTNRDKPGDLAEFCLPQPSKRVRVDSYRAVPASTSEAAGQWAAWVPSAYARCISAETGA
jgi:hypothetical protein